ncbi:MAG: 3-carboxy-cis,cis-muconate cycloisomerase, partial [Gammaproteobacteria bacterium]
MTFSLFESSIYRALFFDAEVAALFEDCAVIQSMIKVESTLAKVQGELGIIPKESADVIVKVLAEHRIEAISLSAATGQDGVPVPALIANLRKSLPEPHQSYLHWGATSQDIMDTSLVLRLADVCQILESRTKTLLVKLAKLASQNTHQPIAARTRSQIATPTSFGAIVVSWGAPILAHLQMLEFIKPRLLKISLAGAVGNSAAFGQQSERLREEMASALNLNNGCVSWHTDRTALAEFSSLMTRVCASLGKLAEDCILANQSEVAELGFSQSGASSTMPQKVNPVLAETIVSLFRISQSLDTLMNNAVLHRQQRDGSAWMQEWFALP